MSNSGKALAPIRKTITVHVPPKWAFDVFTKEMNRWWPPEYTTFLREVIDWQAPERVLLAWQVDGEWKYNPDLITELEVRFVSDGNGGTHVALEHRDLDSLGDFAEPTHSVMDGDEGWATLLERYADATKTS